jgi:type VI secretion system protein ImpA
LEETSFKLFGPVAPSFIKLNSAVEEVRHVVHQLLEKKRETEPDPVEAPPKIEVRPETSPPNGRALGQPPTSPDFISEPPHLPDAVGIIAAAAQQLREQDPFSPAPYLMLRGMRWGELRRGSALKDAKMLEAPPTELRCQVKCLAVDGKWTELLDLAERSMALPSSRAWLDLQRFVVEACVALGPEFDAVGRAIRSEVRALVRDIPELLDATLMDDTPAANAETRSWLRELCDEPADAVPASPSIGDQTRHDSFRNKFVDAFSLAKAAMRGGDELKAFEIMREEIALQRSGRGRFFRRLQFVQLCISAKKETIAQPILEDLLASAETHKIEDWEDRETVAEALVTMMGSSKRIQGDAKEKQKYFERICRLDPVKALSTLV